MRALAYAKDLQGHGIDLTVLTFRWPGNFDDTALPAQIIRLAPPEKFDLSTPDQRSPLKALARKYRTIRRFRDGKFDLIQPTAEARMSERADQLLREVKFDGIIGIFSPHFHLRQCAQLHREHKLPFVIDFRDLWDNALLGAERDRTTSSIVKEVFVKKYWKQWMQEASGFTTVSEPFRAYLSELLGLKGEVVRNGFFLKDIREEVEQYTAFTLTHVGTIVQWEGMRMHFAFLQSYRLKYPKRRFRIVLIGVHTFMTERLNALIAQYELEDLCEVHGRLPFDEARQTLRKSHVLLFPTFRNGRGIYTSRIFEFLAARRPVLCTPDDGDVIAELIHQTEAGCITSDEGAYHSFLDEGYDRMKQRSKSEDIRPEQIHAYSREAQSAVFANYLKACFNQGAKPL